MRMMALLLMLTAGLAALAHGEPYNGPPEGYALVAEDDCGDAEASSHVVRGEEYVFSSGMVAGEYEDRDIIFDDEFCLLRYEGLKPQASYKVDVVYCTEATGLREQTLEANGVRVHGVLKLPVGKPGRFIFNLPKPAYADGKPLELKFIKAGGANAVVSYVRLWCTDPQHLPGKPALWVPSGPVEKDWLRQDRMRGKPRFSGWEDPAHELADQVIPCINEQLQRGAALWDELDTLEAQGLAASRADIAAVAGRRDALVAAGNLQPEAWLDVYRAARWAVRRLAFKHPRLGGELLFVRRHHANAMHQCARRLGPFTLPGGAVCVLSGISAEGAPRMRALTEGRFPVGTFGRPDVSFDGKRILFGYARERPEADKNLGYGGVTERTAPLFAEHAVGQCDPFQVWEMDLAGEGEPRCLTGGPSENSDPLYLPDGRIAFMSHRAGGLVQCGDWALAYCVYTMNSDGSDLRKTTVSKDGEWDPFLLEDGTLGFTRWEYVMKFWSPIQMVWAVRPDGTNPTIIYGSDLSKTYAYPLNYASARQIPGTSKLVCIGSAHHNTGAGPVCVVDMARGPNDAEGLERLTPVRFVETPDSLPNAGWYDCPYPLSDGAFLVSYSFSADEADTTGYGLYLLDRSGNKELIYRDPELSALFPTPLGARRAPATIPPMATAEGDFGEFIIQDVHEGLDPSQRGLAKYVQVVECHERTIHTSPYAIEVGPDSGFETKTVLGTAPVEADGSAYFRVPAGKSVFLSVLDEQRRALHTMRSVTNIQAGERNGCVGCHENPRRAPATRMVAAVQRDASPLQEPQWGVQPMDFKLLVQPVLDKHCIACHDGTQGPSKAFDLTARTSQDWMGVPLPTSYYNLRKHVKHAPMFSYFMPPGSFGSRVSPVVEMLDKGHHEVVLSPDEWHRLCAWIDCNAPGISDYRVAALGLREVRAREQFAAGRKPDPARRAALAAALGEGESLACYLDCGPATEDGAEGGVSIKELTGLPYAYGASADVAAPWYDDITFDGASVDYKLTGLRPDRTYRLGFSWWDFDNGGRQQAVIVSTDGARQEVLGKTRLPAWGGLSQKPGERVVALPAELTRGGTVTVTFANVGGTANAVVSEVWVVEAPWRIGSQSPLHN